MQPPSFQRSIEHFHQNNSFLFAVLGLVSSLSRLDAILEQHAPPRTPANPPTQARDDGTQELLPLALLGLVSLQGTCGRHAERLAATATPLDAAGATDPMAPARPSGLLR